MIINTFRSNQKPKEKLPQKPEIKQEPTALQNQTTAQAQTLSAIDKKFSEYYHNQRVGAFVDVQNMYHTAKHLYSANVNFGKILEQAVGNRQLIRAFAYVVKADAPKEQSFFDALEKAGYENRVKDIQIFAGGMKKGDWDVGMAVDAIKTADRLDTVVLITGDGDFIPLVTYLKENKGCRVEAMAFARSASAKLIESVDQFIDLGEDLDKYLIKK